MKNKLTVIQRYRNEILHLKEIILIRESKIESLERRNVENINSLLAKEVNFLMDLAMILASNKVSVNEPIYDVDSKGNIIKTKTPQ